MKHYTGIESFPRINYPVVTSGTFDGVHVGHQSIIERLTEAAKRHNGQSVLITFWPHPRLVINPNDTSLRLLSTIEEKAQLLEKAGLDHLVRIPFTKAFSQLSSTQFIEQVLINGLGTKKLIIGYDHRFGKNREGSFEHLQANAGRYGFEVEEIPRQDIDDVGVSSTKIRKALANGSVHTAMEYLGRPYTLTGTVVHGQHIGAGLGFPTANIEVPQPYKLIPAQGVYAIIAQTPQAQFKGMLNIGTRPTVNGKTQTIEANLFDFQGNLYGQNLTLHFLAQLRQEQRFDNVEALKQQLKVDQQQAKQALQHLSLPQPF